MDFVTWEMWCLGKWWIWSLATCIVLWCNAYMMLVIELWNSSSMYGYLGFIWWVWVDWRNLSWFALFRLWELVSWYMLFHTLLHTPFNTDDMEIFVLAEIVKPHQWAKKSRVHIGSIVWLLLKSQCSSFEPILLLLMFH